MIRLSPYVAKTFQGLEPVLAKELHTLGAVNVNLHNRAVSFKGDLGLLYRCNYELRTALSISKPILNGRFSSQEDLYRQLVNHPWDHYFRADQTFIIKFSGRSRHFKNSQFAIFKCKDAIVDYFKTATGIRPNINRDQPDIVISLRLFEEKFEILLDSSGQPLNQRGYRQEFGAAPINEVLAAGLVQLSEFHHTSPFLDFMCGSGTLVIEAIMHHRRIPAQILRDSFAFQQWPDYQPKVWETTKNTAQLRIKEKSVEFYASDINRKAIKKARSNADSLGISQDIIFKTQSVSELTCPQENYHIIINPPYDRRIGARNIFELYGKIGQVLKHRFAGSNAWIISANIEAFKFIGLKPKKRILLYNGPLRSEFRGYALYPGSKKNRTDNIGNHSSSSSQSSKQ